LENDKKKLKINNKSIKEYENELSKFDSKICSFDNVLKYIKCKNEVNNILSDYYEKEVYRKLKWYGFINRQRSEKWMLDEKKKIIKTFVSHTEAYKYLNKKYTGNIQKQIKKNKKAYGYYWKINNI
jgi:hypothetical protein